MGSPRDEPTISSTSSSIAPEEGVAGVAAVSCAAPASSEPAADDKHESPWHDYCRLLLRRLGHWKSHEAPSFALGITSCSPGAGVTSLVSHLGSTAAKETGRSVLLIDANLESPLLHRLFALAPGAGLVDLLMGRAPADEAIRNTDVAGLYILPAGSAGPSGTRVLASVNLEAVLDEVKANYDLVLIDLPPTEINPAASWVAGLLDGVLLVLEAERDDTDAAQQAQETLVQAHARLLGVVLNKRESTSPWQ